MSHRGVPLVKGTETHVNAIIGSSTPGHRGVPLVKGTETTFPAASTPPAPPRHRGVPLVKGTETWMPAKTYGCPGQPQRRPPREGD